MTPLFLLASGVLCVWLVAISVIDLRSHRIPDALSLSLTALGLGYSILSPGADPVDHLIGAVAGFVPLALFGEIYFRARGIEGLGLGDAKLFGAAGAWLGWMPLPTVLLIAAVTGLAVALCFRGFLDTGGRLAFGPFIAAATFIVWVVGPL